MTKICLVKAELCTTQHVELKYLRFAFSLLPPSLARRAAQKYSHVLLRDRLALFSTRTGRFFRVLCAQRKIPYSDLFRVHSCDLHLVGCIKIVRKPLRYCTSGLNSCRFISIRYVHAVESLRSVHACQNTTYFRTRVLGSLNSHLFSC